MVAGLTLRMSVALTCNCHAWADELMNYLEQAHRAVFGYGFIPWEFRFGIRTWLIPAIPAVPLWLAKTAGLDSPEFYVPLVYSFNSLISMAIPAGMYFFTRRTASEKAACFAFVFGTLWYELIVLAPRALAETYATAAFWGGLALLSRESGKRIFATGLLLGLTTALRWHYAPVAGALGLAWLISMGANRKSAIAVSGGVLAISVWGLVDFLSWGRWWGYFLTAYDIYPVIPESERQIYFWLSHPKQLVAASVGLYIPILLFGIRRSGAVPVSLLIATTAFLPHFLTETSPYRNLFIMIPALWIIAGAIIGEISQKTVKAACLSAVFAVSLAGILGKLPWKRVAFQESYVRYLNTSSTPAISAATELRKLPDGQVRGVLWLQGNQIYSGGYFYLHRNVPSYFTADPQNLRLLRNALNSGRQLNTIVSHIVTPGGNRRRFEGFEFWKEVPGWKGWTIHRSLSPESVTPLPGCYYDIFDPNWANIGKHARELGIEVNPLPLTPCKTAAD